MVHLDHLYRVAFHLVKDPTDAEDLVQETYLRGFRAFDRFEPGTNLRAWLYSILHNARTDALRKRRPMRIVDEPLEDGPAQAPEQHQLGAELDLERALARVPEVFREALILRDIEELSYDEIARALEVPMGTVMSRIHRGRALIRAALREAAP
jgi:RNA polymerase sigma-70 factor (ECF subfamily)